MPEEPSPLQNVLDVLDLKPAADAAGGDRFEGSSAPHRHKRVFGGQVLGQSLMAAGRTVHEDRPVHSLHGYFLRPGDPESPIRFEVERMRDGSSFSARRVHAMQHGKPILSMIASFQEGQPGLDHQAEMPDVPPPGELPSVVDVLGDVDHPAARHWAFERPIDVHHVNKPIYLQGDDSGSSSQALWMRINGDLPAGTGWLGQSSLLAYVSDYTLLESVLRRHGLMWTTPGLKMASLDHAMWWHRPVDLSQWLLYVQESPSASGGRGLTSGKIFTADGSLVASVAQEGMVRVPQAE